jgi:hypothetical protein
LKTGSPECNAAATSHQGSYDNTANSLNRNTVGDL